MVACSPLPRQGETQAETGKPNEIGYAACDGPTGQRAANKWEGSISYPRYGLRDGIGVGAPQFAPRRTLYVALSKPFTF